MEDIKFTVRAQWIAEEIVKLARILAVEAQEENKVVKKPLAQRSK